MKLVTLNSSGLLSMNEIRVSCVLQTLFTCRSVEFRAVGVRSVPSKERSCGSCYPIGVLFAVATFSSFVHGKFQSVELPRSIPQQIDRVCATTVIAIVGHFHDALNAGAEVVGSDPRLASVFRAVTRVTQLLKLRRNRD